MDPYEGLDADVTIVVKSGGKTEYSAPKLVFKRKESKLVASSEKEQEIYNAITPLSEVFKPLTESEITAKLTAWLEFTAKDGEEVVKTAASSAAATETQGDADGNIKNLDDAFEAALRDE
jgi:hypothetical protein